MSWKDIHQKMYHGCLWVIAYGLLVSSSHFSVLYPCFPWVMQRLYITFVNREKKGLLKKYF